MKLHPVTVIIFTLVLLFIVLVYSNPLYLISVLIFFISIIMLLEYKEKLKMILRFSFFTIALIIIINPLVSNAGHTILLKIPKILFLGPTRVTLEATLYGLNMALKFICIILLFLIYDILTDKDEMFGFFSRYLNRLTLTISITTNVIHRLIIDISRIKEVMKLRGVNFNRKNLLKRTKAYYPIIKVVFISTLEGSLNRAESLFSRQYGKKKRTSYYEMIFKKYDYKFLFITAILLSLFIII